MRKINYLIVSIFLLVSLSIVPLRANNIIDATNGVEPFATTASITLYFENSSGTRLSGTVRIYFPSGSYSDYSIPTKYQQTVKN